MRTSAIQGIDFHCHLDLFPFFQERIQACEEAGIATLTVTTTPLAFLRNLELASKTSYVRAALGLHPQLVSNRGNEIALFAELLPKSRYVGEVGLDAGPTHYASWEKQQEIFAEILRLCAAAGDKIISVHSLRCAGHTIDAIEKFIPTGRGQVVFHWFTGTFQELNRAIGLGCYFSVNATMLRSAKSRKLVREIPIDRLLTESDGPFQKIDGRPSNPLDMPNLISELAFVRGTTLELMREHLKTNSRHLLCG